MALVSRPALDLLAEVSPSYIPDDESPLWFLRARAHPFLSALSPSRLFLEQTFRPHTMGLPGVLNATPLDRPALTLCLGTKQRKENFANLCRALSFTAEGGKVLFCLENDLGAKSYEKHLKKFGLSVESVSKMKSRLLVTDVPSDGGERLREWAPYTSILENEECSLQSHPALFGWNKVDAASKLLAESTQGLLEGEGADLGSGYGYLSVEALRSNPRIESLSLVEAELYGLLPAFENVRTIPSNAQLRYYWADALQWKPSRLFDFILTNPPFHHENKTDPELARSFLHKGLVLLKPGASLYFVSHRTLTLRGETKKLVSDWQELGGDSAFHAIRLIRK